MTTGWLMKGSGTSTPFEFCFSCRLIGGYANRPNVSDISVLIFGVDLVLGGGGSAGN